MKPMDLSVAEVLRLGNVEGVSVRQIARQLNMARRAVRKILGRHEAPRGPRLNLDESNTHMVLDDTSSRGVSRPHEAR
ncbi:MAG: hypothetical protein RL033_1082 [Pseudomonadota bacterium]|jgi:IS30 family transposase